MAQAALSVLEAHRLPFCAEGAEIALGDVENPDHQEVKVIWTIVGLSEEALHVALKALSEKYGVRKIEKIEHDEFFKDEA
jgi:hypothetical protein